MYRCIVCMYVYIYISVGHILPFCLRMGDWHGMFLERNRALAANFWCTERPALSQVICWVEIHRV